MIFKTKMIYDPTKRFSNKLGLTVGLTLHTPKFWSCKDTDFDFGGLWISPPLSDKTKELRHNMALAHASCRWPYRHMSYRGYAYWTGPKRRYEFRYMGATHPRDRWWKPFSVSEHGRYVRWLDNGPQAEPRLKLNREDREFLSTLDEIRRAETRQIKAEMDEWRREH
jgi:hypothetical protein